MKFTLVCAQLQIQRVLSWYAEDVLADAGRLKLQCSWLRSQLLQALVTIASPQKIGKWNMVGVAGQNATKQHVLCPASRMYNQLIIG